MWTEKLKKIISGSLIFFLLFSLTFQIPILQYFSAETYADEKDFYNLVSIIVDEDSYDAVKGKLTRYSRDIQAKLENTQVVILPTPSTASVLDIASLNESLYLEGYKSVKEGVDFESRLIGTVLVGKIPVPVVFDEENSGRSILPYVDFIEKTYIFNHTSGRYEKSASAGTDLEPEIWHGVISPNTGDFDDDIQALEDYFDKNNDFYNGEGVFDQEKGVLDGDTALAPSGYEPQVFYYDQFRENSALQYQKYIGYEMYMQNIEDITYKRYGKDLAEKVKNQVLGIQNLEIQDLLRNVDPEFDISALASGPDVNASSDILTRYITDNATNKFLEIFNSSTLGDMRKYVYNAGRYNKSGSKVNVDMPPFLISVLDQVSAEVIKNVNNSLEREITDVVSNGLSRKIAIPESMQISGSGGCDTTVNTAFYYGKMGSSITSANQCSIYRGHTASGGTLVEANRGFNIALAQNDVELCGYDMRTNSGGVYTGLQGYWGGNSPAGLSGTGGSYSSFRLLESTPKTAVRPIFDILGSKEIQNQANIPSPLDCFEDGSYITTFKNHTEERGGGGSDGDGGETVCITDINIPINGAAHNTAVNWTCATQNQTSPAQNFLSLYSQNWNSSSSIFGGDTCVIEQLSLSRAIVKTKSIAQDCDDEGCSPCPAKKSYSFKTIPSYILHTSPTDEEFGAQVRSLYTPSLPIDKNRYIDFIGAKGGPAPNNGYQKIDFPQLFRVTPDVGAELTLEHIDAKVKEHLDRVSAQMNQVIRDANPSSLTTQAERDLYNLLKTGNYPDADIDLYRILKDKPLEVFTSENQSKEISYYDTLVFAVYWNNLTTVSSKYKFIFENYLGNQFESNNDFGFILPDAKKSYEIAYLAAPGDAENMYIKLDPEQKANHPYASILSANLALQSSLLSATIPEETFEDTFKCGPPDGVNIFQWIPAIICWLRDMLPPKIKISQGSCGYDTLFMDEEEREELFTCEGDVNKNGINDCIESQLAGGSLKLESNAGRYFYNTPGYLTTQILDANGDVVTFDSQSSVENILTKVEVPSNPDVPFTVGNTRVIYDRNSASLSTSGALAEAQKYIGFTNSKQRAVQGETKVYFYGKGFDANISFQARLQAFDTQNIAVIDLQSPVKKVEIRGDQLFLNSFIVESDGVYSIDDTLRVHEGENMYLFDGTNTSAEVAALLLSEASQAPEKALLQLQNFSKTGNALPLSFPLRLELLRDGEKVFEQSSITQAQIEGPYAFFNARESGRYEVRITDASGFMATKTLEVLPEVAVDMDVVLSTSLMETGGNLSTHIVSLKDRFGNPASGELYTLDMDIDGDGILFDTNADDTVQYQIAEGYKAFRLKSTKDEDENTLNFVLKNVSGTEIIQKTKSLRTIEDIRLRVIQAQATTPKVGGERYGFKLEFQDSEGNILTDLQSRVYLTVPKHYGSVEKAYVPVKNGIAEVFFRTSTLAGEDVPFEIQLEGGNKIYKAVTDIHPDVAIKIDLQLSSARMEAAPDAQSVLQAILKDRYDNEVFTDNTTELTSEVHERSRAIISFDAPQKTVSRGKTQFRISGTDIPGIAYFKVSSNPSLSQNTFTLVGQIPFESTDLTIPSFKRANGSLSEVGNRFFKKYSDTKIISKFSTQSRLESSEAYRELTPVLQEQLLAFWKEKNALELRGVGENAGSIETFFFWDKEDIQDSAYNGMYSVLLGAPYGDISQENYLAGALLFDRNNSSLAVSSLLNTPYLFKDMFSLEQNGKLEALKNSDPTQDIDFSVDFDAQGRLAIDVHNVALGRYLGRVYYNIDETSDISLELTEELGYSVTQRGEDVFVKNPAGIEVFRAYESGRFERRAGSYVLLDQEYEGIGVQLLLKNGEDTYAKMRISGNFRLDVTRDSSLLEGKMRSLENTLIVHLASDQYSSRRVESDASTSAVKFYYQDPFAAKYELNQFHNTDTLGLESTIEEAGIGWEASNTMLLSFASGEGMGEATQEFQSFSLINLGDPVASLKKVDFKFSGSTQKKSFDPSVGKLLEKDSDVIGFQTFDYNNDDAPDIITVEKTGYLKLFENAPVAGGFIEQRDLAFAADGGASRLVKTGNFTKDGYDDIFFVTQDGKPVLFNNEEKDFVRKDLSSQISLSGAILQAEVYDMDTDGYDDIVTLDDSGEIHIFYASGTAKNPIFMKKYIGDGYAISLSDAIINQGGAIYFDGLTQIDPDSAQAMLRQSEEYLRLVEQEVERTGTQPDIPAPQFIDESLVGSFLYVSLPYIPTDYDTVEPQKELLESFDTQIQEINNPYTSEQLESLLGNIDELSQEERDQVLSQYQDTLDASTMSGTTDTLSDFIEEYDQYIQYSGYQNTYREDTYFLRSQYADIEGIEVSKSFTDANSGSLQTGDRVFFDITLKNTGSQRKNNVAYVDSIPKYFKFLSEDVILQSEDDEAVPRKTPIGEYDIVLDGFFLNPGEEVKVRYELQTLPLSYGHLQVGLFETGEVGDDVYGDIIIKPDDKNCGREVDIYRSVAIRSYLKGKTTPSCDADAVDVSTTFPQLEDTDDNGVPDYLQNLIEANESVGDISSPLGPNATQAQIDAYNQSLEDNENLQAVQEYGEQALEDLGVDSDNDGIPDSDDTMDNTDSAIDFMGALDQINEAIDEISEDIDELIQGLSCGFGGGNCFANPLNWAPLAPGSVPTLMGMPLGSLTPTTGTPIFSALTGRTVSCGTSPCCIPTTYPASSSAFVPGPACGAPSAGGTRGTWAPTNFVRVFATPTLTGGAGIAVCFGGPAITAGYSNPMGSHPVVPGGNCIVAAMPLFGCEGGEGDPGVLGYPDVGDGFDVIHGNCDGEIYPLSSPANLQDAFVQDYLRYLRTGVMPTTLYENYIEEMNRVSETGAGYFALPTQPLINIGNSNSTAMMSTSIDLDLSALSAGGDGEVVKINNKAVKPFPNFLMGWVERQLDEITSKLTNLPKLFIVLPDFGGIFDFSWKDFGSDMKKSFEEGKNQATNERNEKQAQIDALKARKASLNCSGSDRIECQAIDLQIGVRSGGTGKGKETLSGIKEAYEFLGNIPLVNIETETINVNVPWIDATTLNRFSADWKYSLEEWKQEVESAKNNWSIGKACNEATPAEQERCEQQNAINEQLYLDAKELVNSLERNIEILEEYKKFPEQLAKLINIKEVWIEQIICNIEAIASLLGEWIGTNGKRFKAWVELFILVKAILKSWQLLLDVFNGYEEECHECKNERQDLQGFIFRLISAVIPSPPIIQFPKWPDIILDLHNIRAGMTIYMPDFQMNLRPIVLPTLPKLSLPRVPTAGVSLPSLPTLPRFTIPELPELPSLPTVELPDLPPPPKIPALFGSVEAILNIAKLVTKVMCILKGSPFVPEWRAGDQIAFLTERNGYLPLDFIDIQPPAFSYSAISAIKISAYVNLEFEMDFIVEAVRAITAPLDVMTNNIVNMFQMEISDINMVESVPSNINLDIDSDGTVTPEISLKSLDTNPEGIYLVAGILAGEFQRFLGYMQRESQNMLTNGEFLEHTMRQLASKNMTEDPRTQELQNLWSEVRDLSYSKEDAFIQGLQENASAKFETLTEILETELEYSRQQRKNLEIQKDSSAFIQATSQASDTERFEVYKEKLEPYNARMLDASLALVNGPSEETLAFEADIQNQGEKLMQGVRGSLARYQQNTSLLSAVTTTNTSSPAPTASSCNLSGVYEYRYEGIYVREFGKNYRLFEYTDMLRGDEKPDIVDIDGDGDDDILYLVGGKLYLKENTKEGKETVHLPAPLTLLSKENRFYNENTPYIEALNYVQESTVSDGVLNVEFLKPTLPGLKMFRMQYHTIVDRYMNDRDDFVPQSVQTHVVDALTEPRISLRGSEGLDYVTRRHPATLTYAGLIPNLRLTTEKLQNIREQIAENTQVTMTAGSALYAGQDAFSVRYILASGGESQEVSIPGSHTLVFTKPATITALTGDAYVSLGINEDIEGSAFQDYVGKPLLPGTKIQFIGEKIGLSERSHIDIRYADGAEIKLDMRETESYTLYDLGNTNGEKHRIRLEVPNDFYYAQLQALQGNIQGTWSQQILLAPQIYADRTPPQLGLNQKIRIPVYQEQVVDLTPYIYEDGGFSGIANVRVDFDLQRDSDGDGDMKNDADTDKIQITKTPSRISIKFGKYDTLFEKNIRIILIDDNGNIGGREIGFEVYAPDPQIDDIQGNIITGQIDETLLDEPVRLYRYRGGVIEKLQRADGTDLIETDAQGNYSFETPVSASGLTLAYSGTTVARIDEYTGKIDILSPLITTRIIPSNNPLNESIYPEIQILQSGVPIFRQFVKIPEGEVLGLSNLGEMSDTNLYLRVLDQERYQSYRVPLGVPLNPGSMSVYLASDSDKTPVMTVFQDGRVHIDETRYRLEYRTVGEDMSLVLVQKGTNREIAQMIYHMQASYILR